MQLTQLTTIGRAASPFAAGKRCVNSISGDRGATRPTGRIPYIGPSVVTNLQKTRQFRPKRNRPKKRFSGFDTPSKCVSPNIIRGFVKSTAQKTGEVQYVECMIANPQANVNWSDLDMVINFRSLCDTRILAKRSRGVGAAEENNNSKLRGLRLRRPYGLGSGRSHASFAPLSRRLRSGRRSRTCASRVRSP